MTQTILFDGWSLIHSPGSPGALHLLALLERVPESVHAILALPAAEPAWLQTTLADLPHLPEFLRHQPPVKNTAWGWLAWEQHVLPRASRRSEAGLVQTSGEGGPLFPPVPAVHSPAVFAESSRPSGLAGRLRQAAGREGAARARLLWPADLTDLRSTARPRPFDSWICPPFTSRLFNAHQANSELVSLGGKSLRLPESFVLYHGPTSETALRGLLSAWSWAAGPVGEVFPMVVAGLDDPSRMLLERLAVSYCVSDSVQILPDLPPAGIAALYQRCTVVFHPAQPAPWGDPLLHALACGKPVVSIETGANDLRLGAAAYLAPAHDARALGAALLSVLVEDSVRDMLSAAAVQRALAWEDGAKSLVRMWRETCD